MEKIAKHTLRIFLSTQMIEICVRAIIQNNQRIQETHEFNIASSFSKLIRASLCHRRNLNSAFN